MYLSMAILTATIDDPHIRADTSWKVCLSQQFVWMTSRCMALLAQKRPCGCQQHLMVRAVRIMTIQAAFLNWGMAEDKWAALVGMTLKTDFIDRVRFQERIIRTAMWIVAVTATHLALEEWHMGALSEFYALLLMTLEARFMNGIFDQQARSGKVRHGIVAICAAEIVILMG